MAQQHRDNQPQNERHPFFCEGQVEIRALEGGQGEEIFGYALLFNQRSRVLGVGKKFVEVIRSGACDQTDMADLECHAFHSKFLAVVPNLRYGIDARGLWYAFPVDREDPDHISVIRKIQRGDIKGSSFEFYTNTEDVEYQSEGEITLRYINKIPKIWHVGPVVTPAYANTSALLRDFERFEAEAQRMAEEAEAQRLAAEAVEKEQRDMSGAYDANTNPTDAQKAAGNYKKGKVTVAGMAISVENPNSSVRSGTSPDGTAWESQMSAHYGYILGSKASDDDNLDVFLTDDAETAAVVWVVDQVNEDGTFDEHKCLIGPATEEEARALYLAHYPDGWTGLGAICGIPMEVFRAWAMDGKAKKEPLLYGMAAAEPANSDQAAAEPAIAAEEVQTTLISQELLAQRQLAVRAWNVRYRTSGL